ncbi:unnamed protein product [Prorocentrum cordatum]|uniref:Major facilitator superfamily associated domain-containing protein n=1 Tax=Prorocentrum cordatum TaxID=2364126 RepID=A0ABN9WQX1_9DINO|nr:unnamed protein product [Polarella glacialis]
MSPERTSNTFSGSGPIRVSSASYPYSTRGSGSTMAASRGGGVGFMQLCVPWITFLSSLGWAALCDRLGEYKRVLVVSNSVGAAAICCLLLGPVHTHFAGVCACMFAGSAFLASRTGVVDALTLRVVRDYEEARAQGRSEAAGGELPSYGPQRLWGAAGYGIFGLLSGVGADAFGDGAMFVLFGACLATTDGVVLCEPGGLRHAHLSYRELPLCVRFARLPRGEQGALGRLGGHHVRLGAPRLLLRQAVS